MDPPEANGNHQCPRQSSALEVSSQLRTDCTEYTQKRQVFFQGCKYVKTHKENQRNSCYSSLNYKIIETEIHANCAIEIVSPQNSVGGSVWILT